MLVFFLVTMLIPASVSYFCKLEYRWKGTVQVGPNSTQYDVIIDHDKRIMDLYNGGDGMPDLRWDMELGEVYEGGCTRIVSSKDAKVEASYDTDDYPGRFRITSHASSPRFLAIKVDVENNISIVFRIAGERCSLRATAYYDNSGTLRSYSFGSMFRVNYRFQSPLDSVTCS